MCERGARCEEEWQWGCVLEEALGAGGVPAPCLTLHLQEGQREHSRDPKTSAPLVFCSSKAEVKGAAAFPPPQVPHCAGVKNALFWWEVS